MDIKQLLRKKNWTGEEIGKAVIFDLVNSYQQTLNGSRAPKPLFPPEKITAMLSNLRGGLEDIEAYNRYVALKNWLMQYQAVGNAQYQRFQSAFNEFLAIHNAAESAENEFRYIERLPRIITEKQYQELKARRTEEILSTCGDDTFALVVRTIEYFALLLEQEPKRNNPLKGIKTRYARESVANKGYIAGYNKATGAGYYTLPDGTRSDEVTPEEWEARLLQASPNLQRLKAEAENGTTGQVGSLVYEQAGKEARAAHMGTEKPAPIRGAETFHYYEDARDGLNKWELIRADAEADACFSGYIPALAGEEVTPEEHAAQAAAFKGEFREAVEAALAFLDKFGFKGKEDAPISAAPVTEWQGTVFTWRALYDNDFPGFREWVESDSNIFAGDPRAIMNGVAIMKPASRRFDIPNASIDGNGHFVEPNASTFFSTMYGLAAYTPDNSESGDNIARVEKNRAALEESLRFILGYDAAVDIIAEEIQIPEFAIFKLNGSRCLERTDALNGLFDLLYSHIAEIEYLDTKLKEAKLEALRDVFYPIKTERLAITEAEKKEAAAMVTRLEAFGSGEKNAPGWRFIAFLTGLEKGADE